jgi:hypothetical protein
MSRPPMCRDMRLLSASLSDCDTGAPFPLVQKEEKRKQASYGSYVTWLITASVRSASICSSCAPIT